MALAGEQGQRKENWSDFEKYVFRKLEKIDGRLNRIEIRTAVIAVTVKVDIPCGSNTSDEAQAAAEKAMRLFVLALTLDLK